MALRSRTYYLLIILISILCRLFWKTSYSEPSSPEAVKKQILSKLRAELKNYQLEQQKQQRPFTRQQQQNYHYQRENAAFVILGQNSDLAGVRDSVASVEDRFNHKYNYPYVFLSNENFDKRFKEYTTGLASGKTYYGRIDKSIWSYPEWIDQSMAKNRMKKMSYYRIPRADSESYRHMCRFQSGFFFQHPLLDQFDYYWRVEPDVKFSCNIDYDPFKVMREKDLKLGFALALVDKHKLTVPTLWNSVKDFIKKYPEHIIDFYGDDSLIDWITDDRGVSYNKCYFWSNFEIGSLEWFRSKQYIDFFNHIDKAGGFYYERWSDAAVHSIAAALMLKRSEVFYFYDIGYNQSNVSHCPSEPAWVPIEKCSCEPKDSFERRICAKRFLEVTGKLKREFLPHHKE